MLYSQRCPPSARSSLFRYKPQRWKSWNDGTAKQAILDFVHTTTDQTSPNYVAPEDRVATFDQDGTLWVEHPLYTQAMFALDRVRALAPAHPEWKDSAPFQAILSGDREAIAKFSEQDWAKIIGVTHSGMSTEDFSNIVKRWLETAKHPRFGRHIYRARLSTDA